MIHSIDYSTHSIHSSTIVGAARAIMALHGARRAKCEGKKRSNQKPNSKKKPRIAADLTPSKRGSEGRGARRRGPGQPVNDVPLFLSRP